MGLGSISTEIYQVEILARDPDVDAFGLGELALGEPVALTGHEGFDNQPAFLLADEPTGNLDEENEKLVIKLFQQLHKEGKTIIMVTHNPDMGDLAERVLRLNHGKIDSIQDIAKSA